MEDIPALAEAFGSFHVKSSYMSLVIVLVTILVLSFSLTLTFICSPCRFFAFARTGTKGSGRCKSEPPCTRRRLPHSCRSNLSRPNSRRLNQQLYLLGQVPHQQRATFRSCRIWNRGVPAQDSSLCTYFHAMLATKDPQQAAGSNVSDDAG